MYLEKFDKDKYSTWDELAKEICKKYPVDLIDFVWCLIDNAEDKDEIIDMVCNMKI